VTGAVCRVLPDVAALDRPFDYWAPATPVPVGTIVRVPLHGRRVRGWVLALADEPAVDPDQVQPLRAVVSAGPPADVVALCEWAAWRWAGPRATFLRAASAPNVVAVGDVTRDVGVYPCTDGPLALPDTARRLVVWPPVRPRDELVRSLLAPEGSTVVVAPDPSERALLVAAAEAMGRVVVEVAGDAPAAVRTASWAAARHGACVVVGGRVAALAPVPDLAAVVVLDDADDALVEERAPTWHARDLLLERARRADAVATVVTPAPTVEALVALGDPVALPPVVARAGWPRLEVVDRRREPPGLGLLGERLADALRHTLAAGRRAVCVLNRRGRARLLVCLQCGTHARCEHCGAAVVETDTGLVCPRGHGGRAAVCLACGTARLRTARPGVRRLGDDLAALLPRAAVSVAEGGSDADPDASVVVGTEAALHGPADGVGLVAFLDFDRELLAPRFRAAEQALWLLVRAARRLGDGDRTGRLLVQTRVPDHPVLVAAEHGDPLPLVREEAAGRDALGLPPFGGLAVVSGDVDAVEAAARALAPPLEVLGPVDGRALVRAASTRDLADGLDAAGLAAARAVGRLRVDVDPQRE
jgi:primosomal protein N' (replication factor Y) (superfamily II helicase)